MTTKREIKAALKRALKALETYGWRQGTLGHVTIGFCAWGAIHHVAPGDIDIRIGMGDAIREQIRTHDIAGWNDKAGRRATTVLAAFRRAIEAA